MMLIVTITNTVLIIVVMIFLWIDVHYMPDNAKQFSYIILGLRFAKQVERDKGLETRSPRVFLL